jgi:hypothetical protein
LEYWCCPITAACNQDSGICCYSGATCGTGCMPPTYQCCNPPDSCAPGTTCCTWARGSRFDCCTAGTTCNQTSGCS